MSLWPKRLVQVAFVAVVVGMVVYCATHMRLDSDITKFMPGGQETPLSSLAMRLVDSELSRTMILTVGSEDLDAAVAAVRMLAEELKQHPEVSWVKMGIDADAMRAMYEIYYPRRFYFVSDRPNEEIPQRLSDAGLRTQAERLKSELMRVAGPLVKRIAPSDPLLFFPTILERLQTSQSRMSLRDGVFVTDDGRYAVLFLGTRASAFNSSHQAVFLRDLEAIFAKLQAKSSAPIVLELSGANRIAVSVEQNIKSDMRFIALLSGVGVLLIFWIFFRSLPSLFLATLPHLVGTIAATAVGLWIFGSLNAIAVAFGVSLVGVSIDYPTHLINHYCLRDGAEKPRGVARSLMPSLFMGATTTIVSLLGVAFTDFPGFHQMGVMASVGIGVALLVTLFVVPDLLPKIPAVPFSQRTANWLLQGVRTLARLRKTLSSVILVCVLFGLWGYSRLHWVDDLSMLTEPDPALMHEEKIVRNRVSHFDSVRFVAALAPDEQTALALNDRIAARLSALRDEGVLQHYQSLHSVLWSTELQRENWRMLHEDSSLYPRLEKVYSEVGFGANAFEPFRMALDAPTPPPVLTLETLRETPLGDLARSMVVHLGSETVVLSYLRGLQNPEKIRAALSDLPGALYFDQKEFFDGVYRNYRMRTLEVVLAGCVTVFALLFVRYRKLRPAFAAFLPSLLVGFVLAGFAALFHVKTNLMHLVGLTLVMGMGVDYAIFIVDSTRDHRELSTTLLSLLLACLTTVFVFGMLSLSSHPVLQALGLTAGLGVLLAFLLSPIALVLVGVPAQEERDKLQ